MEFERVAEDADLGEGRLLSVELGNKRRVCLVRVNGDVFAIDDRCTHAEYPLSEGSVESDYELECPLHGAVFDVRDGSVKSPPAEESVRTYEVKVESGGIWVRAD